MADVPLNPEISDEVPWSDGLTAYDESHLIVYVRLLDALAEGASQAEMARIILGIDPAKEPARAHKAVSSHLKRAQWMTESGYRHLLRD
jgi:hypothetical protein